MSKVTKKYNTYHHSNKSLNKVDKDRELVDSFLYHLWNLGLKYTVEGFCNKNGVKRGSCVVIWVNEICSRISLILNHNNKDDIILCKDFDLDSDGICVVINPTRKNNLGYVSRGIDFSAINKVTHRDSSNKTEKTTLSVTDMGIFNLNKWVEYTY